MLQLTWSSSLDADEQRVQLTEGRFIITPVARPAVYALHLQVLVDGRPQVWTQLSVLAPGPPPPPALHLITRTGEHVTLGWDAAPGLPPLLLAGFQLFANGHKVAVHLPRHA